MGRTLSVSHVQVPENGGLKDEWLELENRASPTVFLTWQWIGHWLNVFNPRAILLRVMDGDRLIGMGLVVETKERRHKVMTSRCLRLHQTGQRMLDQIWIEYNGFLAEAGREQVVSDACLSYLCNRIPDWDEFIMGAVREQEADRHARETGLKKHLRWKAPCYGVDLDALRQTGKKYLETLSRNTRYQINRCHRLYRQSSDVELVRPDSLAEAMSLFERIGSQHMRRWGSEPGQSGFANAEFVRFHREFIREHWASGGVDLVCLMAGGREIASFYNLVYKRIVYFYLGATAIEADKHLKPGLLGHSLCIEDYRHHGFRYYDFMGGYERYKSNLGELHGHLVEASLQRNRLKLRIEGVARRARNRWLGSAGGENGC